jgi:hypothetical protein
LSAEQWLCDILTFAEAESLILFTEYNSHAKDDFA